MYYYYTQQNDVHYTLDKFRRNKFEISMFPRINIRMRYVYFTRKPFHGQAGDHVEPRAEESPAGELLAEHAIRHHVVGQLRGHARSRAG